MRANTTSRSLWAGLLCALAMGFLAMLMAAPASADTGIVPGTPQETEPATTEATETATAEATGTVVPSPTTDATVEPTKTVVPTEPTESTPTEPADDGDNSGIAPGSVVVIVWSSDGGPLPANTTVCVWNTCQSAGSVASGAKIVFEEAEQGWQDVKITGASPYADALSSVSVVPGTRSTIEMTVKRVEKPKEELPSEHHEGPIRQPVVNTDTGDSLTWNVAEEGDVAPVTAITALPVTGYGDQGADHTLALWVSLAAITLFATSGAVHRRAATRDRGYGRVLTARLP